MNTPLILIFLGNNDRDIDMSIEYIKNRHKNMKVETVSFLEPARELARSLFPIDEDIEVTRDILEQWGYHGDVYGKIDMCNSILDTSTLITNIGNRIETLTRKGVDIIMVRDCRSESEYNYIKSINNSVSIRIKNENTNYTYIETDYIIYNNKCRNIFHSSIDNILLLLSIH